MIDVIHAIHGIKYSHTHGITARLRRSHAAPNTPPRRASNSAAAPTKLKISLIFLKISMEFVRISVVFVEISMIF